jgi:hypothetical protein
MSLPIYLSRFAAVPDQMSGVETLSRRREASLSRKREELLSYQEFERGCGLWHICDMPRTMAPYDFGMHSPCRPWASMIMRPGIRSLKAKHAYVVQHSLFHTKPSLTPFHRHEHNTRKLLFLRLTAEVRNQIYEHALGNNKLHIFRHPNQPRMTQTRLSCKVCITPCPCTVRITAHLATRTDAHRRHHHICYANPFGYRLDLRFLQTCSQIYMEAFLLPFTLNNLVFAETELLSLFTDKLAPIQAAAITSLTLDNITAFDLFDESYWEAFPSLRNLSATVRGHDGCVEENAVWLSGCRKLNRVYLLKCRQWWREEPAHAPLGKLNLEGFRFRVVCASGHRQTNCRTLREWQLWAKMIEREVSGRWTKQEARRRQEQMRVLQAAKWPTLPPWRTQWRETAWMVVRWIVLQFPIPIWKEVCSGDSSLKFVANHGDSKFQATVLGECAAR